VRSAVAATTAMAVWTRQALLGATVRLHDITKQAALASSHSVEAESANPVVADSRQPGFAAELDVRRERGDARQLLRRQQRARRLYLEQRLQSGRAGPTDIVAVSPCVWASAGWGRALVTSLADLRSAVMVN
jgi:hypothetical protein